MPVDQRHEVLEVIGTAILVIEVIGVLPDIYGQQRRHPMTQRVIAVRQRKDLQLAIGVDCQEDPTRTKKKSGGLVELLNHRAESAKGLHDQQHQFARRLLGMLRGRQLFEEKLVVEYLPSVVGEGSCGCFAHEVAEGHALVLGVVHELVEFVDVVAEVLAIVQREGLCAHHRL